MIHLLGHLLKLPVSIFVTGMEILVRSMQDARRNFEKGVDDMVRELGGDSQSTADGTGRPPIEAKVVEVEPGRPDTIQPSRVEEQMMYDNSCAPDLSGDDVKTVGYWITFQKPDYETTLQPRRDETIDYSTTAESFAGLKLIDFMARLHAPHGIPYPTSWPNDPPDSGYTTEGKQPKTGRPIRLLNIPEADRRYIDVQVALAFSRPKQDPKYDKQQVEVLRQILHKLPKPPGP
jgi:hypothetical protein